MQREPKLLLRLSENGGYSRVRQCDCNNDTALLNRWCNACLRSPHKITDFAGTPMIKGE